LLASLCSASQSHVVAKASDRFLLLLQPSSRTRTQQLHHTPHTLFCASVHCLQTLLPLLLLPVQLSARNTSLGSACNPSGGCAPSSYSSFMIVMSVLLGSFALCLLQRHICWRCRVAGLMAEAQVCVSTEGVEGLEGGGENTHGCCTVQARWRCGSSSSSDAGWLA
jgi:hypothetical protein